jgi:DNA primase
MFNNINVLELLSQHNIEYKPRGNSVVISCLNPYHKDSDPSFSINLEKGFFNCFGCGLKGSYKDLYELITGTKYSFSNKEYQDYQWNKKFIQEKRIEEKKDFEIKVFGTLQDPLKNNKIRAWLKKYGIEDDQYIIDRKIMYSPYTEMVADYLLSDPEVNYTKMVDRIMTPIYKNGKIVNYEGRTYKNDNPKILYVRGGTVDNLYGWEYIDHTKPLVICEGIKGQWRIWNVYKNVIAMMHNIPTEEQLYLLNNYEGELIFFLDNDEGGWGLYEEDKIKRKGTIQYLEKFLHKDFKICWGDKWKDDPNDLTSTIIDKKINNAQYYSHYKIDQLIRKPEIRGW